MLHITVIANEKKREKKYRVGVKTCKDKGLRGRVEEGGRNEGEARGLDGDAERWNRGKTRASLNRRAPGVPTLPALFAAQSCHLCHTSSLFARQATALVRGKKKTRQRRPKNHGLKRKSHKTQSAFIICTPCHLSAQTATETDLHM